MAELIDASQQSLQRIINKISNKCNTFTYIFNKITIKNNAFSNISYLDEYFLLVKKIWNQEKKSILQHKCPLIGT